MRCETLGLLLEEYIQDLLPAQERQIVEAHLSGCNSCRSLADQYREMTGDLSKSLNTIVIPHCLDRVVEAKVNTLFRRRLDQTRWLKGFSAIAAALLLFVGVVRFSPDMARLTSSVPGMMPIVDVLVGNTEPILTNRPEFGRAMDLSQTIDGITVEINYITADSGRLVVLYNVIADESWYNRFGEDAVFVLTNPVLQSSQLPTGVRIDLAGSGQRFGGHDEPKIIHSYSELQPGVTGSIAADRRLIGDSFRLVAGVSVRVPGSDRPLDHKFQFDLAVDSDQTIKDSSQYPAQGAQNFAFAQLIGSQTLEANVQSSGLESITVALEKGKLVVVVHGPDGAVIKETFIGPVNISILLDRQPMHWGIHKYILELEGDGATGQVTLGFIPPF